MAIINPLPKSLGIAISSKPWVPGYLNAWRTLHGATTAGGAFAHFKAYDEKQYWKQGDVPNPSKTNLSIVSEALEEGFVPVMSWMPFTDSQPGTDLTPAETNMMLRAASDLHLIWDKNVIFSFGNYRPEANYNGTLDAYLELEARVHSLWASLGRKFIPSTDCGLVHDAGILKKRQSLLDVRITHYGTHGYGKSGVHARHIGDFNAAIDYQLKNEVVPVFLEIHRWFDTYGSTEESSDYTSAETGAYLLGLKRAADAVKAHLCFFSVANFFDVVNGNIKPNQSALALAGKIQATPWDPTGGQNITYRLLVMAGYSDAQAQAIAQVPMTKG